MPSLQQIIDILVEQTLIEGFSKERFWDWVQQQGGIDKISMMSDVNLDDDYYYLKDDEDDEEEFYSKALDQFTIDLESKFYDWQSKYSKIKFPVRLFRCISIASLEELDTNKLGIYWTDSLDSAECHWGRGGLGRKDFIIEISATEDDVDGETTLYHNMVPHIGEAEQEINLFPGREVIITRVKLPDGTWKDVDIKGRI